MSRQYARLATLIALISLCAFVIDVVSPVTPTPIGQVMSKWRPVPLWPALFAIPLLWGAIRSVFPAAGRDASAPPGAGVCRIFIALICVLLC
ncbi:MAG TPA: hypothetical protein VFY29_14910 [Terriglobia bacterium]|nr:hypothetical protein [Terriglobia bacterium]